MTIHLHALARGELVDEVHDEAGGYSLYRVGDAVSARNIHAAIYDALRICKNL